VAAGLATLKIVSARGFHEEVESTTRRLVEGLAAEGGKGFSAQSIGSMFGVYFRENLPTSFAEVMQCDRERFNRFFHQMLARGVYLAPSAYEAGFVSAAHGAAEIDATLAAARESFQKI
jgi:glutamate-1-semialdehyde 2,1-aminomutase